MRANVECFGIIFENVLNPYHLFCTFTEKEHVVKSGNWYENLVGEIAALFYPSATVRVRQNVAGPDGDREVEVEIRWADPLRRYFVFLECKDWKVPVDVSVIDGLHSKSSDLGADLTMIYSNSGFSSKALAKARRIGIGAMSALASGESKIDYAVEQFCIARAIVAESWSLTISTAENIANSLPGSWNTYDLLYQGLPVQNWIAVVSKRLLLQNPGARRLSWAIEFKDFVEFEILGNLVELYGLRFEISCKHSDIYQIVRHDVTKGSYDHIRQAVLVPFGESYTFGCIDMQGWKEYDWLVSDKPQPGENELRIDVVVSRAIAPTSEEGIPDLSKLFAPCDEMIRVE